MGMYDEIVCDYPLPTVPPAFAGTQREYQSKSLDCSMATYEITAEGKLRQTAACFGDPDCEFINFSGVLEFYTSNWSSSAFGQTFTRDGEDFESVTYEATFLNGQVMNIVETEREKCPALSSTFYHDADKVVDADAPNFDLNEPETGSTLWRCWGGDVSPIYPVVLLAKTEREWALSKKGGQVETGHPSDLGRLLFHTQAEAETERKWRKESWERKSRWCVERLAEKLLAAKGDEPTPRSGNNLARIS